MHPEKALRKRGVKASKEPIAKTERFSQSSELLSAGKGKKVRGETFKGWDEVC